MGNKDRHRKDLSVLKITVPFRVCGECKAGVRGQGPGNGEQSVDGEG